MAFIGASNDSLITPRSDWRELLAGSSLGQTTRQFDPDGRLGRTFLDERHGSRIVDSRDCVRHANDRGEPAAGGTSSAGQDIFLLGLARLPEMHVQINE